MLANPGDTFAGRKLGVLVTDGAPAAIFTSLRAAASAEHTTVEVIAPTIYGVTLDDGTPLGAQQMIGGGPSVLYDAVAVLASTQVAQALALQPAARDFVSDAHAHKKFVAHNGTLAPLLAAAGISGTDDGYADLSTRGAPKRFVETCRALRHWVRE